MEVKYLKLCHNKYIAGSDRLGFFHPFLPLSASSPSLEGLMYPLCWVHKVEIYSN